MAGHFSADNCCLCTEIVRCPTVISPSVIEQITAYACSLIAFGITNGFFPFSIISLDEIADIKLSLGELLTKHMDEGRLKHLEFEFHTAGYYVMLHTTTGLKTAAGYLVKVSYI